MRHSVASAPVVAPTGAGHGIHKDALQGPSAALLDKVRALDSLPRLGELRTLDLRGNDIRVSLRLDSLQGRLLNLFIRMVSNTFRKFSREIEP